jgi:hypothetical protein
VSETDKLTGTQPGLFSKVSKAIAAFEDDLRLLNKADEVIGFVYTEFGRRIKSNDSLGTDHGTTWPAILFGSKINSGIVGNNPIIPAVVGKTDNLPMQNDFRSIYTGLYKQWFGLDDQEILQILGKSFPEIQIITKSTGTSPIAVAPTQNAKLWPNPVEDIAQLSFEADGELTKISIYSLNGQLIENHLRQKFRKGNQQIQLQLGHLPSGVYQLTVHQKHNQENIRFIVK